MDMREKVSMEVQRATLTAGDAYTIAKEATDAILELFDEERRALAKDRDDWKDRAEKLWANTKIQIDDAIVKRIVELIKGGEAAEARCVKLEDMVRRVLEYAEECGDFRNGVTAPDTSDEGVVRWREFIVEITTSLATVKEVPR